MKQYIISLSNVWRVYVMGEDEVHALQGVSFDIEQGEFVSIMGPSGSGKSTCMNMIGCLDRPTSGSVIINGEKTAEMSEGGLARLRNETVGFVFQQYHLLSTMTVLENVMLPLRYQGFDVRERKERAQAVLEQVNLSDRMGHRPSELSGGQKQRVAIARALASRPHIILADEPTGALDSATGRSVMNLFREINRAGTTIIIVTHDSGIGHSAQRCIRLFDGKIESDAASDKDLASHLEEVSLSQERDTGEVGYV